MDDAPTLIVLRYGELFLKGRNRPRFERLLEDSVRRALSRIGLRTGLERGQGRLFVSCPHADAERTVERLRRVFGISSLSAAMEAPREIESLGEIALALVDRHLARGARPASFRVTARRSDKRFPLTSQEIGRDVGAVIFERRGLPVDLTSPALVVGVEVGPRRSFVYVDRVPGAGGLPVGASGPVALLLSGGIDSPVAGHLMQKRGCELHPIHFHSFPYTGERSRDKVIRLAGALASQQAGMELSVAPFTDVQLAIRERCPPALAVVLYRRMMMRIACRLAAARGCAALATGENLGQVASQTLENLACIEAAATLPVLRPLLCHDKAETVELARRIGTYDLSIEPYDDCCSLFVPRHPETRARTEQVERAERALNVARLVDETVDRTERVPVAGQ